MITQVLTEDQIQSVHNGSLAILEKTGIVVPHEEILS